MKTHPEYTATGTTQAGRVKDVCTAEEQEPQVPTQAQVEDFALIRPLPCTSIILDLGDVLAFYSAAGLDLPVSPPTIRRILKSTAWAELECGQISRAACLSRSGQDFDVKPQDIEESLQLLAGTLRYNTELVDLIRYIRSAARGDVKVYLATNITAQDWEILRPAVESWEIIDGIFPSFELGARKPQGQYFKRLLDSIGVAAETALFVDDKADNIVAGRVIGMECVQFVDSNKTIAAIKNAFGDPVARGEAWLSAHAGEMWSETSTGVVIRDTFAQLMILENTSDPYGYLLPKVNIEEAHRS